MKDVLDRDSAVPLYAQIEDVLRRMLETGGWKAGQRIPSESDLQKEFGVSRMTVRGVLNLLADEGLLHRVPGKGTFVSERKIVAQSPAYQGIREQLEARGFRTETELISSGLESPSERVRGLFGLGLLGLAHQITRRRLLEGEPVTLHQSWINPSLAPDIDVHDVVERQLCEVLSTEYSLTASRTDETLEVLMAGEGEAELLHCEPGDPLLLLRDVLTDSRGRVFECTKLLMRGDRMKLQFSFES